MTEDKTVRKLRKQLETALAKRKDEDAIELLGKLMEAEPKAPRWPHKRGEMYRKHNRKEEAIEAYTIAADLYADQGFIARAVAMAKTIIDMDPRATQVLARIDPEAARKLHRQQRPTALSAQAGGQLDAANLPKHLPPLPPLRHPAVLPEDAPEAPQARKAEPPRERGRGAPKRGATTAGPAVADAETPTLPPPPPLPSRPEQPPQRAPQRAAEPPQQRAPERVSDPDAAARLAEFSASVLELAEELIIAPDVQPNETRFSNAPPAAVSLKLALTDLELKPRRRAQSSKSIRPPPPPARKLSQLPLFPLFAEVSHEALVELVKAAEVIELPDAAVVMHRGDPGDALWGIVEGSVDIVVPGQRARLTLAEGDVFGESCLLAGEKRYADVVVRGHLVALKIPRQVFNRVMAMFPRLAEVLLELLTRRLLVNLLQTSPLFQEFDGSSRQELARKFEIRRAPRGTMLAAAGKAMDGLYVNLTGKLEVSYEDGRPTEVHESGTMFGQAGLLTHAASDISVRALANMLVLRLPSAAFHAIAMQYPGILAHVSELAGTSVAKIST